MQVYTVHEPPSPPADRFDRAEGLAFVKEGFTWTAALFTPFWLLAHRMWLLLVGYLAIVVILDVLLGRLGAPQPFITLTMIALHVIIGLEADSLRRWSLNRKGWRMIGSVTGRNWPECERRYFEAWIADEPHLRAEALSAYGGQIPIGGLARTRGKWRLPHPLSPST